MLVKLFLLFTLLPFVELAILLWLADGLSWSVTLAIIVITGVVGAALARREGVRTWNRIRVGLREGREPGSELIEAALIFAAGLLLITPGVLTDLLGFSLLIRPTRRRVARRLADGFRRRVTVFHVGPSASPEDPGFRREEWIDVPARSRPANSSETSD